MNFTVRVKNEIIEENPTTDCCKIAMLSAYLRTSGTIEVHEGHIGFSLLGEAAINAYFESIIEDIYGIKPKILQKSEDRKILYMGEEAERILFDAMMLAKDKGGMVIELGIPEKLVKKHCCQKAYIKGAFLGGGTITIPKMKSQKATGYHMEFVFSKYLSALDFCHILSENGLIAKLIERKDSFVVYSKNSEEICDILVTIGAKRAFLEVQDIIVKKMVKNNTNRIVNCEMSNLTKQIDASYKSRTDINEIDRVLGLTSLPASLYLVAKARLDYPDDSLSNLAARLNISKSCLSHRLKRLSEIAQSL